MTAKVYEFLWRGPVVEGDITRGSTFHVILDVDGKHTGPLTPQQAKELHGFGLNEIQQSMLEQALEENISLKNGIREVVGKLEETEGLVERMFGMNTEQLKVHAYVTHKPLSEVKDNG